MWKVQVLDLQPLQTEDAHVRQTHTLTHIHALQPGNSALVNRPGCSLDVRVRQSSHRGFSCWTLPVCMSLLPGKKKTLKTLFYVNWLYSTCSWINWPLSSQTYSNRGSFFLKAVFMLKPDKKKPPSLSIRPPHDLQPPLEVLPGVLPWPKHTPTPTVPRAEGLGHRAGGQM